MTSSSKRPQARPTVQVDNERVVVTEWRFPVGSETGWHRHGHDYVVVPMTSGHLMIDDGKETRRAEMVAGSSYYRPAGVEHNVINDGDGALRFLEVEIVG